MTPVRQSAFPAIFRQRGAALAVSLALLLALTLLALATSRATRSQTDFVARVRERDVAFQAAEAALRAGERLLASTTLEPCATERCRVYADGQVEAGPGLQSVDWRERHAWTYTSGAEWIPWSKERPPHEAAAFVIEETFPAPDALAGPDEARAGVVTYRITAAAYTRAGRPAVILQSTFARPTGPVSAVAEAPDEAHGERETPPLGRQSWRQLR